MSLAHELGHLVLHQGDGFADRQQAEREAATFASAFLLPRASMIASGVRVAKMDTLLDLKHDWGVSIAGLVYRLHTIGMLSERCYRSAFIELSSLGWRLGEPADSERCIAPESSQLVHKVLTTLRTEGVTRSDVARHCHLYVADLDALLAGPCAHGRSPAGLAVRIGSEPAAEILKSNCDTTCFSCAQFTTRSVGQALQESPQVKVGHYPEISCGDGERAVI